MSYLSTVTSPSLFSSVHVWPATKCPWQQLHYITLCKLTQMQHCNTPYTMVNLIYIYIYVIIFYMLSYHIWLYIYTQAWYHAVLICFCTCLYFYHQIGYYMQPSLTAFWVSNAVSYLYFIPDYVLCVCAGAVHFASIRTKWNCVFSRSSYNRELYYIWQLYVWPMRMHPIY